MNLKFKITRPSFRGQNSNLLNILVLSVLFFMLPSQVHAQTYDKYAKEYLAPPQKGSIPADLKQKLENEVQKVVNAGHLAPFRTLYGEDPVGGLYDYFERYDSVYTLSAAYPYVSAALQNSLKTYIKNELTNYPVWDATYGSRYLNASTGARREPDFLPAGEIPNGSANNAEWLYRNKSPLFGLYALWVYAHNTGDWAFIEANWSTIKTFYTNNKGGMNQFYSPIAGGIGMYRMAMEKPTKDAATAASVLADLQTAFTNGTNYPQYALNSENLLNEMWQQGGWDWYKPEVYLGFQFMDISPEIGRFMADTPSVKSAIQAPSTNPNYQYSVTRADHNFPLWYMAQAPQWSHTYGEASGTSPRYKAMVYPVKFWVQKEPASQLRKYVDVPDALLGDFYYMQVLTRTMEAYAGECWEDVTTTAIECPVVLSSAVPSSSPSPSPSPSPLKTGDLDANNKVDIFDYNILLTDFGKTGNLPADLDKNGKVDIFDYNILLTNFGK